MTHATGRVLDGGCLCGAVRYRIDGTPRLVSHRHCLHCRRSSGAAFLTWLELDAKLFHFVRGTPASYESRPRVTRQFCGQCGSQLTWQNADDPSEIDVTACSLDDPSLVVPQDHIWCDRMLPWVKLADGLPRFGLRRQDG